eukprot:3227734-Rhodomonas_salina.1
MLPGRAPRSSYACPVLRSRMLLPARGVRAAQAAISLRACYAMSGTDEACITLPERAGEEMVDLVGFAIILRACYAMPGTGIA